MLVFLNFVQNFTERQNLCSIDFLTTYTTLIMPIHTSLSVAPKHQVIARSLKVKNVKILANRAHPTV